MIKICLCPSSIAWIRKHLRKSAKAAFSKLISRNAPAKTKRKSRKGATKRKRKAIRKLSGQRRGGRLMQQRRFAAAAKKCKGKGKGFRPCMKRELKRRR